ncbi:MAG: transcriptional regulator [Bacteroidales bacterium]|nr:transcriptional regulator [Bacteroidales bacterium]
METKDLILKTMTEAGKPLSAGEVATLSGIDRKEVDKVFAALKKEGLIVSPVRCKWQPAQ